MPPSFRLRFETPADAAFVRALLADMKAAEFAPMGMPPEQLAPLIEMQVGVFRAGLDADFPDARRQVADLENRVAALTKRIGEQQTQRAVLERDIAARTDLAEAELVGDGDDGVQG